jgi:hypothetical protein
MKKKVNKTPEDPGSWMGKTNPVKMTILLKEISGFKAIPIKILMSFFAEIEKAILKYILKVKRP